jgi:murein L,D-transpeptidase YcbB/YkuD
MLGGSCMRSSDQRAASQPPAAMVSDPLARRFYEQRGWRPAWTATLATSLDQAIGDARRHGLDPGSFASKQPAGADPIQHDADLTLAALRYARALSSGVVDPGGVEKIFTLERNKVDVVAGLERALAAGNIGAWLGSLAPADAEYKALSDAYLAAVGQPTSPSAAAQGGLAASPIALAGSSRQLAANLERRRWLNRSPPAHRIDVNTAGAFLVYLRPSAAPLAARAVVGRLSDPTPSIQGSFRKLVANPPWRVPTDIARKEILPKGRGYLAREQMRFVDGLLEQRPGPRGALGRVKFDVQDPYDIYLHDTPEKKLFALPERHRSHGCVRVENAVDLARLIAGEHGKADAFDKALASKETADVDIGETIPVRMLYHTAFVDEGGGLTVAPDVYGWDNTLAAALGLGSGAPTIGPPEPPPLMGP